MTQPARILPYRPVPSFTEPPDTLLALLEAAEGLPDETVARLIDRYFPAALLAPWQAPYGVCPAIDRVCARALCTRCSMPSDAEMDAMIARAAAIPQQRPRPAGEGQR